MNEQFKTYLEKFPTEIIDMFTVLQQLIYDSVSVAITPKMWAKIPSFYVGDSFIRLIPFKDHMNIEASAILKHQEELKGYKITPKGMLQISLKQDIPVEVLKQIFAESLS